MDKEAQKRIKEELRAFGFNNYEVGKCPITLVHCQFQSDSNACSTCMANGLIEIVEQLGYRKLPEGEPPLLSDEEITETEVKYIEAYKKENNVILNFPLHGCLREDCIKQAQREVDIKFYKGGDESDRPAR